ncbi:ABC-2 type transport system permease protein [Pedococcus cremeus]|uniref:Transport permease protein n=1 Tax=Pedococcus cremeus TaxID=587636 RepID=A0A1H9TK75_9MICO|nr:ABC transporter permease [Pedococcus cremeus]SER97013.1 ABC-2 type transport system permease protein [Pedococcus cremeus]
MSDTAAPGLGAGGPASQPGDVPPLVVRGRGGRLAEALGRRYLLSLLVRKELRVRYRASVLGLGWSYVKPAVQFGVYFVALGMVLRQREIGDYAVYLFGGLAVVSTFSEAVSNSTRSVVANADLVRKIYLPRELFPLSSVCVAAVHLAPQLVVLGLGALACGWRPDAVGTVALLASLVLVGTLALGVGLLLGSLNVLFRDLENLVDLLLMVLVWLSPVFYSARRVTDLVGTGSWLDRLYQANPLTVAVELMHRATWANASPGNADLVPSGLLRDTVVAFVLSVGVLVLGQAVFRRLTGRFAQEL